MRPKQLESTLNILPSAWISGRPVFAAAGGVRIPVFNAASGAQVAWQEVASELDVDAAVCAARAAFEKWRSTETVTRGEILARVVSLIEGGRRHLVELQMRISGKPWLEANTDVDDVVACFSYYAELCLQGAMFREESIRLPDDSLLAAQYYEPVGVAALIVPWNFPMVTTAWKLAPAMAAGCAVVLKPSEITSLTEHALVEIVTKAGVPEGVINIVNGGAGVGALLTAHPLVDKISFTGGTAAGRQVMRAAAEDMKRLTLELGGKSSLIIRQDAEVDMAVRLAVDGAFMNAGQMCSATSRILVHDSLYHRFMAAFERTVQALVVGPPDAEKSDMGPLISRAHLVRVKGLLQQGVDAGARVAFSGRDSVAANGGFFMAPVVIAEPAVDNVLWTDEVFGPVACVKSFHVDDEAIELANGTRYGLVATVVTQDVNVAKQYQARLRAGLVWINTPQLIYPEVCWGGMGLSGCGRELGVAGLRSYQELRHVIRSVI